MKGGIARMKFNFLDPAVIMSVVVALIILGVGVFAFFMTIDSIPTTKPVPSSTALENKTYNSIMNVSETGDSVFNIVGVVLIIGAIMAIIGIVYSYIKPGGF